MPDLDHGKVTLDDLADRTFAYPYEAAAILRVDVRTLRSALAAGEIPSVKTGQQYRVPVAWLRQAALSGTGYPRSSAGKAPRRSGETR
jgi:excisionase family DNA binding protein